MSRPLKECLLGTYFHCWYGIPCIPANIPQSKIQRQKQKKKGGGIEHTQLLPINSITTLELVVMIYNIVESLDEQGELFIILLKCGNL